MITLIISATIALTYIFGTWFRWKQDRRLHRLRMRQERLNQLYFLRVYISNTFGEKAYNQLPDYDTMLNSDKPLEVKEWVEVDKLVNLN